MWNDFLEPSVVFVVVTLSSSVSFAEVGFLGAIESDCNVGAIELLTHVDMDEPLDDLTSHETDLIVL